MSKEPDSPFFVGFLAILSGSVMGAFWAPWRLLAYAGVGLIVWALFPSERRKMQKVFKRTGLFVHDGEYDDLPLILAAEELDGGTEYTIRQPCGLNSDDWKRKQLSLSEALNARVETRYEEGRIKLRCYTHGLLSRYNFEPHQLPVPALPIGHSQDGFKWLELGDSATNLLVAGETGSGKSSFMRQAIVNLILTAPEVSLHLIDLKRGVEFGHFEHCATSFAPDIETALTVLEYLDNEQEQRYEFMRRKGFVSVAEYNSTRRKLPYHICFVDEFANLRGVKGAQERFDRLLRVCRAAGIHFVLGLQRPSAENLPGTVKANIQATLAFACRNEVNSRIALDSPDAARLEIPGRAVFQVGRKDQLVQVEYLTAAEARELTKHTGQAPPPPPKQRPAYVVPLEEYRRSNENSPRCLRTTPKRNG